MDPITLAALEYDGLKRLLASRLKSPLGHQALSDLAPAGSPITRRLTTWVSHAS